LVFTGIVQAVGSVRLSHGGVLALDRVQEFSDLQIGESIAVNGCCLTLASADDCLRFELSQETLSRTALSSLREGSLVNLERALLPSDRLGGHFVQGHIDAVGYIVSIREAGNSSVFSFRAPPEYDKYLVDKGSVCIDGISLTVVSPRGGAFDVWVIPHTLQNTALRQAQVNQPVNLEFDMLAKYLEKLLGTRLQD
jgi:riboflavin synthase